MQRSASPNIPLSSTVSSITAPALLPYIPPHPQQGTPYHRYTVFLFAQSSPLTLVPEAFERTAFSTREFVAANDLKPAGVHFFRELYEAGAVAQIYEEMGEKMPRFGRERRRDPYKEPRDPKYQFQ
jgi:large subunit ribosomal protein L35